MTAVPDGPGRCTYLVGIRFRAEDVPEPRRADVLAAERKRGEALREAGNLVRIWRVPGGADSVSIWSADDADDLHDMLASLPIAPWTTFDVTALAHHPLEGQAARP
jgi:muconolactone D-isomerase